MEQKKLMNINKIEPFWIRLKAIWKKISWFVWLIPLFLIVSYTNGIAMGLFITGIMISGLSLGMIFPTIIGAFLRKYELKTIYGEIIIFLISTSLLYFYLPEKKL